MGKEVYSICSALEKQIADRSVEMKNYVKSFLGFRFCFYFFFFNSLYLLTIWHLVSPSLLYFYLFMHGQNQVFFFLISMAITKLLI